LSFCRLAGKTRRKTKCRKKATGLRALRNKKNGFYQHTLTGKVGKKRRSIHVTICVASKYFKEKKSGKRRCKKLLYALWKVRMTPREIREIYRKRFGIETSYRQMNEARIKTSTRDPQMRLLFVGIALVLRNVWVWLHFKLARAKWDEEPQLFLELLRFKEMLLWISQVVGILLGANQCDGIEYEAYQRLITNRRKMNCFGNY
jgi:IS4 transposase